MRSLNSIHYYAYQTEFSSIEYMWSLNSIDEDDLKQFVKSVLYGAVTLFKMRGIF
jgi:hypothetical protein